MSVRSSFWIIAVSLACHGDPLTPGGNAIRPGSIGPITRTTAPEPTLMVLAPGQLVAVEVNGATERAWFEARLIVRADGGGVAAADGAILVVSANDGPMPQTSADAATLRIEVRAATVETDGTVRFVGTATRTDGRRESAVFDVTGSARPSATVPPDELIWDIVGGNVHEMSFPAVTTTRLIGGTT